MSNLINSFWAGENPDAWDSSKLTVTGNSIAQIGNSVFMKPDGTEVYVYTFPYAIRQYTLSTPFDVSTAGSPYVFNSSFDLTQGIAFRESDGKKMYGFGDTKLSEWDLTTGWDLSTMSVLNTEVVTGYMTGCYAKQDGTTFYSTNQTTEDIHEFDFSSAWDSSTFSETASEDVSSQLLNAQCVFWKPDGTRMFINRDAMYAYDVSPDWDVTGITFNAAVSGTPSGNGMWWSADGLYCLISGTVNTKEYYIP